MQAVRLTQPLLWRPFGWCRLQVDVAGRQRKRRENSAQSGQMRAVLPVGSLSEAQWLLSRIIPAAPVADRPAPTRSRVKAPLSYHWLSWGSRRALPGHGQWTAAARSTHWVPLAKVQSFRVTEGPLQRRLHLASIHVDTAGRAMRAALRDRSEVEVGPTLVWLVDAARRARTAARPAAGVADPPI